MRPYFRKLMEMLHLMLPKITMPKVRKLCLLKKSRYHNSGMIQVSLKMSATLLIVKSRNIISLKRVLLVGRLIRLLAWDLHKRVGLRSSSHLFAYQKGRGMENEADGEESMKVIMKRLTKEEAMHAKSKRTTR